MRWPNRGINGESGRRLSKFRRSVLECASMDPHTLDKIEFERVRLLLAEHCNCALGKWMAAKIKPVARVDLVRQWIGQVQEMIEAAARIDLPPFGGVRDVRGLVESAVPPHSLEPEEFAVLADTFAATHEIVRWAGQLSSGSDELRRLTDQIGDFKVLADAIRKVVGAEGSICDNASAKLYRLRVEISEAQIKIGHVIDRLLRDKNFTRWLRYPQATFHDDRLVLPLAAEHRGRIPGIIHRSSESGATLFVEPEAAVQLNNQIIDLKAAETAEINRLLWHLTHQVHLNQAELMKTLRALAVLDFISAKVRFAWAYDMHCPEISERGRLYLHQARHPLLVQMHKKTLASTGRQQEVVPIDVRLGEDFDILIVTGPNTGGKTVALKTVALCCAMAQAGLPIPAADGSTVPIYKDILVDIGDEQSLQQSLSTFSAHLGRLMSILKHAHPHRLVLIDELGAGTDPDEGAAIGQAIVEELLKRHCPALITTHLGVLKSLAFTQPRAENACVDFDVETLRPTYRLLIGEPGNSNAINIANRLGLPPNIIQAARKHLSSSHEQLSRAIAGTLLSRRQAERARADAEKVKREAEQQKKAAAGELAELQRRQEEYQRWVSMISSLQPGDEVHVRRFDREGRIVRLQLHKQVAVVSVGAMEMEVPLKEITRLSDRA